MQGEIPESEWKLLRKFHTNALERHCQATIEALGHLCVGTPPKFHDRYLEIYNLVESRNDEMAEIFDNMLRRSVALRHIATLRAANLITDDEFAQFSAEVQAKVTFILDRQ